MGFKGLNSSQQKYQDSAKTNLEVVKKNNAMN
jgi:hypothetical protein